jgi:hypothetical protein
MSDLSNDTKKHTTKSRETIPLKRINYFSDDLISLTKLLNSSAFKTILKNYYHYFGLLCVANEHNPLLPIRAWQAFFADFFAISFC